jgi:hypothetical protein
MGLGTAEHFKPYAKNWTDWTGHKHQVPIVWGERDGASATCTATRLQGKWHKKHIIVDIDKWYTLDTCQRQWLIIHELIHCELEIDYHERGYYKLQDGTYMTLIMSADINLHEVCSWDALEEQTRDIWSKGA